MFKWESCLSVVPVHKNPKLSSSLKLDKTSLKLLLLSVYLFGHGGPVGKDRKGWYIYHFRGLGKT